MRPIRPLAALVFAAACSGNGRTASESPERPIASAAVASSAPVLGAQRSAARDAPGASDVEVATNEPAGLDVSTPPEPAAGPGPRTIRLFYPDRSDLDRDCVARASVERRVSTTRAVARQALDELVRGPTAAERAGGLSMPFDASAADPARGPLEGNEVSVRIRGRVAVVSFRRAAAPFLNQAICARVSVTSAIEATLLQFPTIEQVRFAVEGDVIDEWDG